MISCTAVQSDAIILLSPGSPIQYVSLPGVSQKEAEKQLDKLRLALHMCGIPSARELEEHRYGQPVTTNKENAQSIFQAVLSWLSTMVVSPVFENFHAVCHSLSSGYFQ